MSKKISVKVKTGFSLPVGDLIPLQGALKQYSSPVGFERLKASLIDEGIFQPSAVWKSGDIFYIWDGHGRQEIYKSLIDDGWEIPEIPVVYVEAKSLTDAKRILLKKEEDYMRRVTSGGLSEFISDVDINVDHLADFNFPGLESSFIEDLLKPVSAPREKKKKTEQLSFPDSPVCSPGDLWKLGSHVLLCGDSKNKKDVHRLLSGATPQLMVTNPPYDLSDIPDPDHDEESSDFFDWQKVYEIFNANVLYVWHDPFLTGEVQSSIQAAGYEIMSQLIWAKRSADSSSRGDYSLQHEPCWYSVKNSSDRNWKGNKKQTTLLNVRSDEKSSAKLHTYQKPVECMAIPIRNSSSVSDIVVDPFLGSGTTLIACEETGRRCHGMERSESLCDVVLRRFISHTGDMPVRSDGKTFLELCE